MTDEFEKAALRELIRSFPLASQKELYQFASILWDLLPKIYNGNANEEK